MSEHPLRFGVWAPVHGNRAALQDPDEPYDASWERNRDLVLLAERLGFDATLVAQHFINPHERHMDQLETWTAVSALAALTSRIELIAAIKPLLFHPVVLAKMAIQIDNISQGRLSINVINAWNKPEIERAGIPFLDHDERYAYGDEWTSIVSRLMAGERVTHQGRYFAIDDYALFPKPQHSSRPGIYVGGESDPARDLVARHGDVWFINGQPPADVRRLIDSVRARPRQGLPPVRFGLAAFVIARETDEEAQAEHARLRALAEKDKPLHAQRKANIDPKVVMHQTLAKLDFVGSNGGTAAGLVGSYETVADRILDFHANGIELFMLQFQPLERELLRFSETVAPLVRRKQEEAAARRKAG